MTEGRTLGLTPRLGKDIEEILQEAQHRWLRPVEICEILRNHHKFHIASEPPNKPPSGSLFLFDRKVLRYFRKDGHNWRKKKDGKTVKEAHEKLKTGSIDVLHCYYAHGEDNFFQRRSYWMLEEDMMHIVLVHYRDVKGSKGNFLQNEASPRIPYGDSPTRSNFSANQSNLASQATDLESLNSEQLSEYEDTDSDITQSCSRHNSLLEVQQYGPTMNVNLTNTCKPGSMQDDQFAQVGLSRLVKEPNDGLTFPGTKIKSDMASWHEIFERCSNGLQLPSFDMVDTSGWANTMEKIPGQYFAALENILNDGLGDAKDDGLTTSDISVSQSYIDEFGSLISSNINGDNIHSSDVNHLKQPLDLSFIDNRGLKKNDSFSKWRSNELGVVGNSYVPSNSGIYWSTLESKSTVTESNLPIQDHWDTYLVGSSLSHNQLFSILDISPNWAYTETETKVLIRGKFLVNKEGVQNYNWSCMFGEIEVRADILADGILCCHAPSHKAGRVPLCVTCSNRFPCSEIREFAYKMNDVQRLIYIDSDISDIHDASLLSRLENLLTLDYIDHSSCTVCSMMMEVDNELLSLFRNASDEEFSGITPKGQLLQEPLKEKLHTWLLHKVGEDGKGPNVFDKKGQGVLHLAAALGYDWAIKPVIAAGVSINFRDVHGWTALHWAAFCGRERTVVTLIALDASPGAVTDPTPEFPSGRTPADLASQNGYKGISGFLAESSLVNHLQELTLKDSESFDLTKSSELLSYHHDAKKGSLHNTSEASQTSLKDSLSAVRNATEAAARIYQVFRVQSFNRKKLIDYSDEKCKLSDEDPLSFISVRSIKPRKNDLPVHAAAIKIQKKFRGWKGRKEFLSIRQHIIKIQAHVRGHQVRKHYRKILWSVGIVEKAILRWRRKGSGLRGFRSELLPEVHINQNQPINEDDYDFLQVGRKQTEARLETALARVKSMVQYPEARDQYSRLLNVVEELQESNFMQAETPDEMLEPVEDLMLELEGLLGD